MFKPVKTRETRTPLWFFLIALSIAILLAACGDSSPAASSASTPPPTDTATATATTGVTPTAAATKTPTAKPGPTPTPTAGSTPTTAPTATPTPRPTATPTPTPRPTATPTPTPVPMSNQAVLITTDSSGTYVFSPAAINITVGTTVTWTNKSGAAHTVTSDDGSSFESGAISTNGSFSFKFTRAGTYKYHCRFHPYMVAVIVVK